MRRCFLFLQGPSTPFFFRLANRLNALGHVVHCVSFCAGDVLYWGTRGSRHFSSDVGQLHQFLDGLYRQLGITDQVLFGDQRSVHRPPVEGGKVFDVRTHVFEEGYVRPHWVTLEREGVNAYSLLPRDPDWFWKVGGLIAKPAALTFHSPFYKRAFYDVAYHLAGLANPLFFPRYRTHADVTAPVEYAGYIRRLARLRFIRKQEQQRALEIAAAGIPYYLLPLQLNSDAQIRHHSRFENMGEVIEFVLESFARQAPSHAKIVIKNHPLDPGLMNFARIIHGCERRLAIGGRVEYLEEGDLMALLTNARGVVTVNSTVGMSALEQGTPTHTLGDPIYNLPGLTWQTSLDTFWGSSFQPNRDLFERFRRCVIHATQVNGGFYSSPGMALAVENSARILTADRSPLECLL